MKIIDGKNAVLGRLASYAAKEALKGEEIVILNCKEVIITGNRRDIKEKFEERRRRTGSGQKGPRHPKVEHLIVKRAIRGMLPNYRRGRGKEALKRIKCYNSIPQEYAESKKIVSGKEKKMKFIRVEGLVK